MLKSRIENPCTVDGVNHKPDWLFCGHLNDGRLEREFVRHHLHFRHGIRA